MPTDPVKSILDRDLSKAQAREFKEEACSLLREVINNATWLLRRSVESASLKDGKDIAALALFRQIIELADALEVIISECCVEASVPLIRNSFEALISLEYILKDEALYLKRSHAWIVSYYFHLLDIYDRVDPATVKGKNFLSKSLENDRIVERVNLPDPQSVKKDKEFINEVVLKDPNLQVAIKEYKIRKNKLQYPKWHNLFGGPSDIYGLACEVGRGAQHDIVYRLWSRYCHAGDPSSLMDGSSIRRIRDCRTTKNIAEYSISFLLCAIRHILHKFRQGENVRNWYETEQIEGRFKKLLEWKF